MPVTEDRRPSRGNVPKSWNLLERINRLSGISGTRSADHHVRDSIEKTHTDRVDDQRVDIERGSEDLRPTDDKNTSEVSLADGGLIAGQDTASGVQHSAGILSTAIIICGGQASIRKEVRNEQLARGSERSNLNPSDDSGVECSSNQTRKSAYGSDGDSDDPSGLEISSGARSQPSEDTERVSTNSSESVAAAKPLGNEEGDDSDSEESAKPYLEAENALKDFLAQASGDDEIPNSLISGPIEKRTKPEPKSKGSRKRKRTKSPKPKEEHEDSEELEEEIKNYASSVGRDCNQCERALFACDSLTKCDECSEPLCCDCECECGGRIKTRSESSEESSHADRWEPPDQSSEGDSGTIDPGDSEPVDDPFASLDTDEDPGGG